MTDEEKDAASAYLKLHEDVKALILTTIKEEFQRNPYGPLAMEIGQIASGYAKMILDREIQNYRIVYRGNTASY